MFGHYFFGVAIFVTSVFLVMLVLVQRGRGGGLVGALGGPGGQSALGTKAGDVFTRITIVVAAIWIFLCAAAVRTLNPSDADAPAGLSKVSATMGDNKGAGKDDSAKSGNVSVPGASGAAATSPLTTPPPTPSATTPPATTPPAATPPAATPPASDADTTTPAEPKAAEPLVPSQPAEAKAEETKPVEPKAEEKPAEKPAEEPKSEGEKPAEPPAPTEIPK